MLAAQFFQAAQPIAIGDIQTAFTLHTLHQHRRRQIDTRRRIAKQLVHHLDGVGIATVVTAERHTRDVAQRHTRTAAVMAVTRCRNTAQSHTVKAVGERYNGIATGHFARQLHRRFNGVGASGASKLEGVLHIARLEDVLVKRVEEVGLGVGVHIQTMGNAVAHDVLNQRFFEHWVVVAVVQRARPGEKIQVFVAVNVVQVFTLRLIKRYRE